MIIAIDYDDTYTRDPKAWDIVILTLRLAGHEVHIVTGRNKNEIVEKAMIHGVFVYYTNGRAKKMYMETMGIKVDVWIDDRPEYILHDQGKVLNFN